MPRSLIEKLFFHHVDVSPYGCPGVRGGSVKNLSPLCRSNIGSFCLSRPLCWNTRGSGSMHMIKKRDCVHTQTTHKHQTHSTNPGGFGASCFHWQQPPPLPSPALFSRAVTAAALIMKAKIFYSDLLIWKWSMPVDRGTVLLNLSTRSHSALTPGFICLVGSDSRILPALCREGSPRDFSELDKTHSDKEQPLY